MAGFGSSSFGTVGLGTVEPEPEVENRSTFSSSRKIDAATGRYVQTDEGGFAQMSSTAQRVLLAISFNVKETDIIDPRSNKIMEGRIRKALEFLTKGPSPAIALLSVAVVDDGKQTTKKTITFRDLNTGATQTVEAR
jgi:hypothetical protein